MVLLWLWHRWAGIALIGPLGWEPRKDKKKKKKKKRTKTRKSNLAQTGKKKEESILDKSVTQIHKFSY